MSETAKFEGHLATAKRERVSLGLKIQNHITQIRELLDPYEDIAELKCDAAAEAAVALAGLQIQYRELSEKIRSLEKALGR